MDFFKYNKEQTNAIMEEFSDVNSESSSSHTECNNNEEDDYDENDIEYSDKDSVVDNIKEIEEIEEIEDDNDKVSNEIDELRNEIEILKLRESVQLRRNRILYNDMKHISKMDKLVKMTSLYMTKTSMFYKLNKYEFCEINKYGLLYDFAPVTIMWCFIFATSYYK